MLKYNFKLSKETNLVQEIKYDTIYMSPDLTYISGITSSEYGLVNNQPIFIREGESDTYKEYIIQVYETLERGYVDFLNQQYRVFHYMYNDKVVYGIIFADNNKYIADSDGKIQIKSINVITESDGDTVEVSLFDGDGQVLEYVNINTRYYIYNSIVTIGGIDYEVDYGDESPSIELKNGTVLLVNGYNKENDTITLPNTKKRVKFIIRKSLDYKINVEHISYAQSFKYIISGNTYDVNNNIINDKLYLLKNEKNEYYLLNRNTSNKVGLTDAEYNPNISINTLTINNITYEIFEEWKNTNYGNNIHLYLDDSEYSFKEGDIIKAINRSIGVKELPIKIGSDGKKYVVISGVKYFAESDKLKFMSYDNKEYEIYSKTYTTLNVNDVEETTTQYYIVFNDTPLLIDINGSKATRHIESKTMENSFSDGVTYDIKEYEYIIINENNYIIKNQTLVKNQTEIHYEVIYYNLIDPIKLVVVNVTSSNQLRCVLLNDSGDDIDTISNLVNSHYDYSFELENPLFDGGCVDNKPSSEKDYKNIKYRIYKSISNINLPLKLSNFNGNNLNQEYVCQKDFFNVEIEKSINKIIDLEKDVYYPAYYNYQTKKFTNIDRIIIDLHFRSRDLSTWKINNDFYNDTNSSNIVGCNWNILDYYNHNASDSSSFKPYIDFNKCPYYQPSDLLYFLNFTDDDIFYQKSKVGKSFLRLSFYDTPDARTQSLLSTSTVFINEGNLYKKFINNKIDKGLFLSANNVTEKVNIVISKNVGVNLEEVTALPGSTLDYSQVTLSFPQNDNVTLYPITMNDDNRLSASFIINNMFECSESSEGFYLYLFKEYSTGIHERDIYLKVEFNHAGVGRTLTFMQPYKMNGNEKEMLNMTNESDISLLKNGCKLQDMYDYIYIKIHVKYDFETKRYYYYFPEWLTKHNDNKSEMRLNLYELKIADESLTM